MPKRAAASAMPVTTVLARFNDGTTRTVPVSHIEDGLGIQRTLDGAGWVVVHLRSGQKISRPYCQEAQAYRMQQALLEVDGVNWRWTAARLKRLPKALRQHIADIAYGAKKS